MKGVTPVLELVCLSGCILLGHLLLNVLVCPPIKDTCLDLVQHLQAEVTKHGNNLGKTTAVVRTTIMGSVVSSP